MECDHPKITPHRWWQRSSIFFGCFQSMQLRYRLCVTMDGDIGIFRRSGWGKHGALAALKRFKVQAW